LRARYDVGRGSTQTGDTPHPSRSPCPSGGGVNSRWGLGMPRPGGCHEVLRVAGQHDKKNGEDPSVCSANITGMENSTKLKSRGQAKPESRLEGLLSQPDAAKKVLEARVAAHRIEEGMHFKELQNVGLFFVGLFEPEECLVVFAKSEVRVN